MGSVGGVDSVVPVDSDGFVEVCEKAAAASGRPMGAGGFGGRSSLCEVLH